MDRRERAALVKQAKREAKRKTPLERVWAVVKVLIGAALVALLLALLVVPRVMGGTSLTILSGSMEPTFSPGDIIAVRGVAPDDVCDDVNEGDIVTFMPNPDDPTLITHRVLAIGPAEVDGKTVCALTTQGDANSGADAPITSEQVRAVFMYSVPELGWVRQWLGNNLPTVGYVGAGLLIVYGLATVVFPRTKTRVVVVEDEDDEPAESSYYWTI